MRAETGVGAWLWASGKPAVHRGEPDLGAVTEDDEGEAEPDDGRVEVAGRRHEGGPVERLRRVAAGVEGRQVEEHGSEEGEGDADRAE